MKVHFFFVITPTSRIIYQSHYKYVYLVSVSYIFSFHLSQLDPAQLHLFTNLLL
jgi:hypothetical protein